MALATFMTVTRSASNMSSVAFLGIGALSVAVFVVGFKPMLKSQKAVVCNRMEGLRFLALPSVNGNIDASEYAAFDTVRKGDCTGDWRVTPDDIPCFVSVLLGYDTDARHVAAADMTGNGVADGLDVQPFVTALLGG